MYSPLVVRLAEDSTPRCHDGSDSAGRGNGAALAEPALDAGNKELSVTLRTTELYLDHGWPT